MLRIAPALVVAYLMLAHFPGDPWGLAVFLLVAVMCVGMKD